MVLLSAIVDGNLGEEWTPDLIWPICSIVPRNLDHIGMNGMSERTANARGFVVPVVGNTIYDHQMGRF